MHEEYSSVIEASPLFEGISGACLQKMLHCLAPHVRETGEGELLLSAGESTSHIAVVLKGRVHGLRQSPDGGAQLLMSKGEGGVYGEILACTGGAPSPVSVYAIEPGAVMLIDFDRILAVCPNTCNRHELLLRNVFRLVSVQYFDLHQKIALLSQKSLRAKICAYLRYKSENGQKAQFIIQHSRSELAQYLGAERSALSRELGRMKKEGIIDYYKASFKILDILRL